jgi:hypothetical protein
MAVRPATCVANVALVVSAAMMVRMADTRMAFS